MYKWCSHYSLIMPRQCQRHLDTWTMLILTTDMWPLITLNTWHICLLSEISNKTVDQSDTQHEQQLTQYTGCSSEQYHCTALIVVTSFSGDQWVIVHHQIVVTCYSLMWSHIPRIKLTVTTCNLHVQISVFVLQLRINRLQSDWSAYQIQWPQLGCLWL